MYYTDMTSILFGQKHHELATPLMSFIEVEQSSYEYFPRTAVVGTYVVELQNLSINIKN